MTACLPLFHQVANRDAVQCLTAIRAVEHRSPSVCLSPAEFNNPVVLMIPCVLAVDMAWQSFFILETDNE
jgi:hypothetical protein